MSSFAPDPTDVAPSAYLPGTPLPVSSRPDLAFVMQVVPAGTGPTITYTVSELYVEIPLSIFGTFMTDGTPTVRLVDITAVSGSMRTIWDITAPATQPASASRVYILDRATSFAYAAGTTQTMPLPTTPLIPGDKIIYEATNVSGGDAWSGLGMTLIRIPTGPQLSAPNPTAPLTPILV